MTHNILFICLANIFGLIMIWGIGANGLANIMSTTIGSKAISIRQALIIAIVFEFIGAFLGGNGVAETVKSGIINAQALDHDPITLIHGMLAVLAASMVWMTYTSHIGMPVSITNVIVGALVGFAMLVLGPHAVHWHKVIAITVSWIASPLIAGFLSYLLFRSVQKLIFTSYKPLKDAERYINLYLFLVGFVLSEFVVIKTLIHLHFYLHLWQHIGISLICGVLLTLIGQAIITYNKPKVKIKRKDQFIYTEKMFALLMLFTACAMVYAHGSNDVAISIGPIAAVLSLIKTGHLGNNCHILAKIILMGCTVVIIGFITFGRKIIITVGSGITALTPSRAFCATIAAAITVVVSTSLGIPLSATQTLVGAVLGVGMARGIGALDMRIVRNIILSWIVTLPIAAGLTTIFYYVFSHFLP